MKLKLILILAILGVIIGCGGENSSRQNNNNTSAIEEEKNLQIPIDVSINIPTIFMQEGNYSREDINKASNTINTQTELAGSLLLTDYEELSLSTILINHVFKDIVYECQNKSENTQCTLLEDTIQLTFTQNLIDKLKDVESFCTCNVDKQSLLNQTFPLGKIEFNRYDTTENYQYELIINTTRIEEVAFNLDKEIKYTFKWSKDNLKFTFIKTQYFENQEEEFLHYSYQNISPNIKQVTTNYRFFANGEDSDYTIFSTFTEEKDKNISYQNTFQQIDSETIAEKIISNHFLTKTILTNNGGAHFNNEKSFIAKEMIDKYYVEDIFNNNGTILETTICDALNDEECEVYNPATWENNKKYSSLANIIYKDLNIEGGELENGYYYFLPPNFKEQKLTLKSVTENQIGHFIVFQTQRQGILENKKYINQLKDLIIVYATESGQRDPFLVKEKNKPFEFLKEENRPDLSWIDTLSF